MKITLLHDCGDDLKGAVVDMDDRRAQRLIRTGYAVVVKEAPPKKAKSEWQSKAS